MGDHTKALEDSVHAARRDLARMEMWFALGGVGTADASALNALRAKLARAEAELTAARPPSPVDPMPAQPAPIDVPMGGETTGLEATVRLRMDRLATSMAHLFAFRGTPLVSVEVKNLRPKKARVAVHCHIEGYSAEAIDSTELDLASSHTFHLFPPLFPERVRTITELCAASLHIRVDDLDDKSELIQAKPIRLLPPTTAILGYLDPTTQQIVDQRDLLAAYVTPNNPAILELLRTAADFSKLKAMLGYQTDADGIREHVRAIYATLNAAKIVYIDSRVAFGAAAEQSIQRIRLPRESLECRSANCIDGTVLMASLLEATGIDPLIVLVPGHAYLGFRPDPKKPTTCEYVETTLIGTKPFDEASAVAMARTVKGLGLGQVKQLDIAKLREAGITPME